MTESSLQKAFEISNNLAFDKDFILRFYLDDNLIEVPLSECDEDEKAMFMLTHTFFLIGVINEEDYMSNFIRYYALKDNLETIMEEIEGKITNFSIDDRSKKNTYIADISKFYAYFRLKLSNYNRKKGELEIAVEKIDNFLSCKSNIITAPSLTPSPSDDEGYSVSVGMISNEELTKAHIILVFKELNVFQKMWGDADGQQMLDAYYLRCLCGSKPDDWDDMFQDLIDKVYQASPPELKEYLESKMSSGSDFSDIFDLDISAIYSRDSCHGNLFLGKHEDGFVNTYFSDEKSIISIAPPGSGKTQCHVLPNLNCYPGAAIVLDIKGECFLNSYQWRSDNVGPVMVFSPAKPEHSKRYNPLSFVSQDPEQVWEDARLLAEMLVVPQSQNDPTWETQGRQLLTVLIAYTAYLPDEQRNMSTILDLLSEIGLDDALSDLVAVDAPFPSSMRRTANKFLQMRNTAGKQFQGVLSGASQHLTIWEGSAVEKVTSTSDWSPDDFRQDPPITLYLHVPPNAIETYAPLLRIVIAQHVRHLMMEEPDRNAPPILFMLDELPRLGKMEPVREALEVGRSYGIKLWMFVQYVGQLQDAYGKEIANGMIEACGAQIYMNPSADIAEKLSKTLGQKHHLITGKPEPLVSMQELMGPEWRDDMLVLATGEKPLRLRKAFFHEQSFC